MSGINFNSLFGNTGGLAGMLGDYQAIKSGSYAKLMKSYYGDAKKSLAEHPAVQRQRGQPLQHAQRLHRGLG